VATILHIEDDDAMALVFYEAIHEAKLQATVYRVSDGDEALAYLRAEGRYANRSWPDIVYLDLNLPKVDGWQVLTYMRADGNLRSIPVVILSTSFRKADVERAESLGVELYLTKPAAFTALIAAVESTYRSLVARA
jgi:CheY-like chemotaxis protein